MLISGSPQILLLPVDREETFIYMPRVTRLCTSLTALGCIGLTARPCPLADHLVRHDDAALGEQLLDVATAEMEANGAPDRMCNDRLWTSEACVGWSSGVGCHATSIAYVWSIAARAPSN